MATHLADVRLPSSIENAVQHEALAITEPLPSEPFLKGRLVRTMPAMARNATGPVLEGGKGNKPQVRPPL